MCDFGNLPPSKTRKRFYSSMNYNEYEVFFGTAPKMPSPPQQKFVVVNSDLKRIPSTFPAWVWRRAKASTRLLKEPQGSCSIASNLSLRSRARRPTPSRSSLLRIIMVSLSLATPTTMIKKWKVSKGVGLAVIARTVLWTLACELSISWASLKTSTSCLT